MKSEKEIRELFDKLDSKGSLKELDEEGFLDWSGKAGHWLDCLSWVLEKI